MIISSMSLMIILNVMGSFMVISSSSWFSTWIGIELTSMTIPPLMNYFDSSLISKINSWKYYMIQCYASSIFLLAIMCLSTSSPLSSYSTIMWLMITVSMLLKMGIIPFQGWFHHISISLPWTTFLILSSIQKIGPLVVISESFSAMSNSMELDILISSIISLLALTGLTTNFTRYFLITSSMINSAWMIASAMVNKISFVIFMTVYFLHLFILLHSFNKEFSNQMELTFYVSKKQFEMEMSKLLIILSLIGMPPLIGFFTKMSIMEHLIISNHLFTALILSLSSSIIMLIYIKLILTSTFNMRLYMAQYKIHISLSLSMLILLFSPMFFFM